MSSNCVRIDIWYTTLYFFKSKALNSYSTKTFAGQTGLCKTVAVPSMNLLLPAGGADVLQ